MPGETNLQRLLGSISPELLPGEFVFATVPSGTPMLAIDADRDAVAEEAQTASRMGVTGVPCFLFEGKYAVMGAQDTSTLTDAIKQIAAAKAKGELDKAG